MGSGSVARLKQLQVLQNKIIRIMIFKVQKDCVRMSTVYKSLNILQIADKYELEIAKFMHSFYHNNLPAVFGNYFKSANTHHTHNTRSITQKNYYLQERILTVGNLRACSRVLKYGIMFRVTLNYYPNSPSIN